MMFLGGSKLVKIIPFVVLLWWFWFHPANGARNRRFVIESVLAAVAALALSRLVQNLGPQRLRPERDESLHFTIPFGGSDDTLFEWSSFPSDHAALVFALSAALYLHHRSLGIAALLWSAVVVCFPRVYNGYHYPSDMIAGAALGTACVLLVHKSNVAVRNSGRLEAVRASHPAWFGSAAFFLTQQISNLFDDIRQAGRTFLHPLKYLFRALFWDRQASRCCEYCLRVI